ncbi:MAG: 6-phosphogluconolactonase [Gemmatimonadaceae bacterium]|nr:6-phosphogluconolactonase [Gemmatimonadaceae bacterium]
MAALAAASAERFIAAAEKAIATRGRFVVALSGGSSPRATYERLAREPLAHRVDWSRVHVVWGDERCVTPADPSSNYKMAYDSLLDRVPLPTANIHRIRGEEAPERAAESYEAALRNLLETPTGPPSSNPARRIDLVLLGLGDNGHTASLFPEGPALDDVSRWVVAAHVNAIPPWRVTMTLPLLNAAAELLFIVAGKDKAAMLNRVRCGPPHPRELPAQLIAPTSGRVHWLVDAEAAAQLGETA